MANPFMVLMLMTELSQRKTLIPSAWELSDHTVSDLCATGYFETRDGFLVLSYMGEIAWERLQRAAEVLITKALKAILESGRLTLR